MEIRRGLLLLIVSGLLVPAWGAEATSIWLSGSNTIPGGTFAGEVPSLGASSGSVGNAVYIWARPDSGKTLVNWSLNIVSTNSAVIDFTGATVHNPVVTTVKRYESTGPGTLSSPAPDSIDGFQAFTITGSEVGIGPGTTASDPLYDATTDAWLMATILFDAVGAGSTDLFLQIGSNGINNQGDISANTSVIFGALTDPGLNGDTGRGVNSLTADATIRVPEPTLLTLFAVGGLVLIGRRR